MNDQIKRISERRQRVWHERKTIADGAAFENRNLHAEEQQSWERLNSELDDLDARLADLDRQEKRVQAAEETMAGLRGSDRPATDNALEAQFRDAIVNRNPKPIEVRGSLRGVELRTLTSTGFVPTSFFQTIVRHLVDSSAILAAGATLVNTESGEPLKVPRSSVHSTAGIVSENTTIPTSDPTLGSVTLNAYKYGFMTEVSYELATDSNFDLLGYLAEQAGTAVAVGWGAHAVNGTGNGQPRGLLNDTTTGGTCAAATFTTTGADALIDVAHSVPEGYARSKSAGWIMRITTLAQVRKLKASGTGQYVFSPDIVPETGSSGTLYGKPVYVDPNLSTVGAGNRPAVFGDFSRLFVRQAQPLRWESSQDFAFDRDVYSFRGLSRMDSAVIDTTGALRHLAIT